MTCAFAVRGALKKFAGVESVEVSLNKGLASAKLKPGNSVTVEQFWEVVRKNGYTPKATHVIVRGQALATATKLQLKVLGTNRVYDLVSDPKSPKTLDDVRGLAGKTVTVEGTLTPAKDASTLVPLQVQSVGP